jgi:hypothetical protein
MTETAVETAEDERGNSAYRAQCDCGWVGRRRVTKTVATWDAEEHSKRTGHPVTR